MERGYPNSPDVVAIMMKTNASIASVISDDQVMQYRANGFTQINDLFTGDELIALRDAVQNAVTAETLDEQPENGTGREAVYATIFDQKVNLWQRHNDVARFTLSPRIASIAEKLEGCPMRVWHDQALFKEPGKGNNRTPWHQDAVYWPHRLRRNQTSVWIALDDVPVENGCMAFIPGSHSFGILPTVDLAEPHDIFRDIQPARKIKPEIKPLKAGSATFHNGLTLHYAGPNRSDVTRRAFAIIYMPDGTAFDGGRHLVTDDLALECGDLLSCHRFPKV